MSAPSGHVLQAVPFAIRLHREFRGVTVREGMLIQGPSGWGEFAPFDDYSDQAAARWLDSALEAAFGEWPDPVRTEIEVNAIIPAVASGDAAGLKRAEKALNTPSTVRRLFHRSSVEPDRNPYEAMLRDVLTEEVAYLRH